MLSENFSSSRSPREIVLQMKEHFPNCKELSSTNKGGCLKVKNRTLKLRISALRKRNYSSFYRNFPYAFIW